jgi:predicted enzyme related to lactoylglutathione lyase
MGQRVVHFEITADDPKRAAEFYKKVFGWELNDYGGPFTYILAGTGDKETPGIDGAIMDRIESKQAVVNTIDVPRYEDAAQAVIDAGGKVNGEKTAVPNVGWFSYCTDTEGNVFGIMEADANAK